MGGGGGGGDGSESARLPPVCPGYDSWTWRHIWVESFVGSLLYSDTLLPIYFDADSEKNSLYLTITVSCIRRHCSIILITGRKCVIDLE